MAPVTTVHGTPGGHGTPRHPTAPHGTPRHPMGGLPACRPVRVFSFIHQPVTDFTHALTHALIHTHTTPHPHHSTPEPTPEPEPEPYQAQRARFAELGARFAERTRHLSEPSAVDEGALLKAARQTAETAPLLEWLRLLASACMQVR